MKPRANVYQCGSIRRFPDLSVWIALKWHNQSRYLKAEIALWKTVYLCHRFRLAIIQRDLTLRPECLVIPTRGRTRSPSGVYHFEGFIFLVQYYTLCIMICGIFIAKLDDLPLNEPVTCDIHLKSLCTNVRQPCALVPFPSIPATPYHWKSTHSCYILNKRSVLLKNLEIPQSVRLRCAHSGFKFLWYVLDCWSTYQPLGLEPSVP